MTYNEFTRSSSKQGNKDDSNNSSETIDWAKEAYERLKREQQERKEANKKNYEEIKDNEDKLNSSKKEIFNDNLEDQNNIKLENIEKKDAKNQLYAEETNKESEIKIGDFDKTFTWSAEVLAAQGKNPSDFSLEEIDWLSRLKQGLEKSRKEFVTDLLDKFGDDPLTPEIVDELETLLLRADAGVKATDEILDSLRTRLNEDVLGAEEGLRFLKEKLCEILDNPINKSGQKLLAPKKGVLNIWLIVGVNGVGKTTTLGKLTNLAMRSGYSSMIAAADTFRAAAVEQLRVWANRSSAQLIANETSNADPAAVVFDAINSALSKNVDLLLVDTAGRLQTKNNLMEELKKIRKIIGKLAPNACVESLLVLDSSQGQNGLRQALAFAEAAQLTGVVITKLDGTSRGGVAMAVASETNLPIRFIGAGEGILDLRPFNSFEFVEALLAR